MYKPLGKSILLYNCGTWALNISEEERLNAYHGKQLNKILNIRYHKKITNKIPLQNVPRKATVNTNAIGSLESLGHYYTKRQCHSRK